MFLLPRAFKFPRRAPKRKSHVYSFGTQTRVVYVWSGLSYKSQSSTREVKNFGFHSLIVWKLTNAAVHTLTAYEGSRGIGPLRGTQFPGAYLPRPLNFTRWCLILSLYYVSQSSADLWWDIPLYVLSCYTENLYFL